MTRDGIPYPSSLRRGQRDGQKQMQGTVEPIERSARPCGAGEGGADVRRESPREGSQPGSCSRRARDNDPAHRQRSGIGALIVTSETPQLQTGPHVDALLLIGTG